MGYTHYWHRKKDLSNGWNKFIEDVRRVYENLPKHSETAGGYYKDRVIKICGGFGEDEPRFDENEVWFNGDGELGHETFWLPRVFNTSKDFWGFERKPDENGYYFDCCKTARKPYDLLVCCVLILAKTHFNNRIKIDTDGRLEDWTPAFNFMQKLGFEIPKNLFS